MCDDAKFFVIFSIWTNAKMLFSVELLETLKHSIKGYVEALTKVIFEVG